MKQRDTSEAVFVSRQTAAQRLEISVDTFDTWVHVGFVPPAHINRGQTQFAGIGPRSRQNFPKRPSAPKAIRSL